MFNFRPKIENKIPDSPLIEEKPYIEDTEQNKEKSLTPEIIKKIYEKGRLYIMTTIISLGMFQVDKSGSEGNFDYFTSKFKNLPKEKSHEIYDDLNKILSPEDFSRYVQEEDSTLSTALLNDSARKVLTDLSSMFKFYSWDIAVNLGHYGDEKNINKITEKNTWEKVEEISGEFPLGQTPTISAIPYDHLEYLNDPVYFEGLKRLANLGMAENLNFYDKEIIAKVAKDDSLHEFLKKVNNIGPRFDMDLVSFLTASGPCPEGLNPEYWEHVLGRRSQLEKFLDSHPNRKVLDNSKGCYMSAAELEDLMEDSSGRYLKFFQDENNQESIKLLYSYGYTFQSMMFLLRSHYENMINEPAFLEVLRELKFINYKNDASNIWFHILDKSDSYYNFNTKEGFEALRVDLKRMSEPEKADIDQTLKHFRDLEQEKEKQKQIDFNDNIVFWLSNSGEDSAKFMKDPAIKVVFQLGYEKNPPAYLQSLEDAIRADWIMRVARNMYITKTPVTPENFEQTFYETVNLRTNKELIEKPLFKGRNVALFAHNEKWGDDTSMSKNSYSKENKGNPRFGKRATRDEIMNQHPTDFRTFKAKNTVESLERTESLFLEYVATHSDLTILVDAHGGEESIYLTQGIPKGNGLVNKNEELNGELIKIDVEELSSAFESRYDKGILDAPIIIMSSCYNQNFIRNLCEKIIEINKTKNKEIPLPIATGDSDYGQVSYSDGFSDFGGYFFKVLLKNKKETKIKDILEFEASEDFTTEISLFVPFTKETKNIKNKKIKQKVFYQITQHGGTPLNKTLALQYADDLLNKKINDKTASYWEYTNPQLAHEIRKTIEASSIEELS